MDPRTLIETFGTLGIFAIVFAESGLLVGFFLPGDSLLFTAGLLASQGKLNIGVLVVGCCVAAVAGDQVGYLFGRRVGPALFRRPNSRLFKRERVEQAQGYFDRFGAKSIVLARFIPVVRTFAPIVAGIARMRYATFTRFNVLGGLAWAGGVLLAGYWLGRIVPSIDKYLLPVVALIVAASIAPVVREILRTRRRTDPESLEPVSAAGVDRREGQRLGPESHKDVQVQVAPALAELAHALTSALGEGFRVTVADPTDADVAVVATPVATSDLAELRAQMPAAGIIAVGSSGGREVVAYLDAGADDCLNGLSVELVAARVRAIARHKGGRPFN